MTDMLLVYITCDSVTQAKEIGKHLMDKFLKLVAPEDYILDTGCSSARDSTYFVKNRVRD